MTDDRRSRHPDYLAALDRSRPLAERRGAYARWAGEHSPHVHPGAGWHTHGAGDRVHSHNANRTDIHEEDPR